MFKNIVSVEPGLLSLIPEQLNTCAIMLLNVNLNLKNVN